MGDAPGGLLFVQADVAPEDETAWNRWYDRKHVPDLLSVPGISSGRRFERSPGSQGVGVGGELQKYLALYDLDSPDVLVSEPYKALSQPPVRTDEDRTMLRLFRNVNRAVFAELSQRCSEGAEPAAAVGCVLTVGLVPAAGYEEEYHAWYEEEHIPYILKVPGVLRVRRFRAVEGEPQYLAVWDLVSPEVRQSEAFARAAETPWTFRMRKHCERRLTALYQPHVPL
jgi:hypothetical protein